jgi:hypothetical protein
VIENWPLELEEIAIDNFTTGNAKGIVKYRSLVDDQDLGNRVESRGPPRSEVGHMDGSRENEDARNEESIFAKKLLNPCNFMHRSLYSFQ